jgi:chemotaxis protein MotB
MSKKKHPEHVNHERWLVSYADFITLLFAFFVVLFASGQSDKRKQIKLAQAIQSAFQYNGIFDQHAKTPPLSDEPTSAPAAVPSPLALPVPTAVQEEKRAEAIRLAIEQHLRTDLGIPPLEKIGGVDGPRNKPGEEEKKGPESAPQPGQHPQGVASVTVHRSTEGIVVSLREAGFFDSGSAEVRPDSLAMVRAVAESLPHQPMRVEGHTDNVPIHTAQFATNWELSTARAAAITRMLLAQHAADPAQISAAGYAEFQPTTDNQTEAGRAQNRRVDIVLLNPK